MAVDRIPPVDGDHGKLLGLGDDDHPVYLTCGIGTFAARPAANSRGGSKFLYFASDTGILYVSDGATWAAAGVAVESDQIILAGQVFG